MNSLVGGKESNVATIWASGQALVSDPNAAPDERKLAELMAMWFTSSGSEEDLGWIGPSPKLQKRVDDRAIQQLRAHGLRIPNYIYDNGIEVEENDLADDKLGQITKRIRDMIVEAQSHYAEQLFNLLAAGFTATCYDGQFFFDTDHPTIAGDPTSPSFSNKQSGALTLSNLGAAIVKLRRAPNERGEAIGAKPTHVIASPEDEANLLGILVAYGANGASNIYSGRMEPIISSRVGAGQWFVADFSRVLRPLIVVERQPLRFQAVADEHSYSRFMRGKLYYGVDARSGFGYGLPQLMVGSTGL